jgi:hypothetical protein
MMANEADSRHPRILIVDDDADARALARRVIARALPGAGFVEAPSLAAVEPAWAEAKPDLVVTDYYLADGTGLEVVETIRRLDSDVPVVMFTGTGDEDIAVRAMRAGVFDYLRKSPAGLARMPVAVQAALENARTRTLLREAETRYRELFESVPIGLFRTTPEGRFLDANPAYLEIFGYPDRDALLAADVAQEFADPADRARVHALVESGHAGPILIRARRRDGTEIWVESSERTVRDASGQVLHYEGAMRDVTERVEAEAAVRETSSRFRAILDNTPAIIILRDVQGRYLLVNRQFERRYGRSSGEVVGKTPYDILTPEAAAQVLANDQEMIRTGEPKEFDERIPFEGGDRDYLSVKFPIRDAEGTVTAIGVVATDITDRLRTETALKESERRQRLLAEAANAVTEVWDVASGAVLHVSPNVEAVFGLTPAQWIEGRYAATHIPPEDYVVVTQRLQALRASGDRCELRYRLPLPDGRTRWVREYVGALRDPAGRLLAYGFIFDETESKEREDQLLQAQKMETVGQLAGGVAHDFNNLLAIIMGGAELLQLSTEEGSRPRALADQILGAAERGADLTRRLLAFSQQQVLQPALLDLDAVVRDTLKMVGRLVPGSIALGHEPLRDPVRVYVDRGGLENVLVNLVVNARDAMPEGGRLTIATRRPEAWEIAALAPRLPAGAYVELAVADTGTGMSPEVVAKAFQPFFTTKGVGKGTGLGLSLALDFAKQFGGTATIESEPGRGTVVRLLLPLAEDAAPERAPTGVTGRPTATAGRESVLVVEDDEALRRVIAEALTMQGYEVLVASGIDGARAHLAAKAGIAAVVSDIILSERESGLDVARQAKEARPDVVVVLMSGYAQLDDERRAEIAKLGTFLAKPFHPRELAATLRRLLDERAARA